MKFLLPAILIFYSSFVFSTPNELEKIQIKYAEMTPLHLENKPKKIIQTINLLEAQVINNQLYVLADSDEGENQNASVEFLSDDNKNYLLPIELETSRSPLAKDDQSISSELKGLEALNLITPKTNQIEINLYGISPKIKLNLNESRLNFQSTKTWNIISGFSFKDVTWNEATSTLLIEKEKFKTLYEKLPSEQVQLTISLLDMNNEFTSEQIFTIQKSPIYLKVQITNVPPLGWKSLEGKSISIIGQDGYRKLVKASQGVIDIGYIPRDSSYSYWITVEDAQFIGIFKQSIGINEKTPNELKFDFKLENYCVILKCAEKP